MGLIVQDNTGAVAGANSYLDVAAFKAYHDDRGADYSGFTDPQIEAALIRATDYLDQRFSFTGKKIRGRDQTTEWPRTGVTDRDGYGVDGLPHEVTGACAEYAIRALSLPLSPDPVRDDTGALVQSKSETVGPITESVAYVGGALFALPKYPAADQRLIRAGFVRTGGEVVRG
jgi:hypothetical protein